MAVEDLADLVEGAADRPGLQDRAEHLAGGEAIALLAEVHAQLLLDQLKGGVQPGRLDQRLPLVRSQRDDHHAPVVGGEEVAAEGAVEVVALLLALAAAELRLGDLAEVADHREGDVGERPR